MPINNKHLLHHVPHGINPSDFKRLPTNDKNYKSMYKHYLGDSEYSFVIGFNSRNAHRKHPANLILGFKTFCDNLPIDEAKKCALILHSDKVCEAGTDLPTTIQSICPDYKVTIHDNRHTTEEMCAFYNICDVLANVSSNEGFGLSVAEAIMCETPVIATVTGGLQDQLGITDNDGNEINFSLNFATNSVGKYKNHGKWAKPVWPKVHTLQGSPPTPYIFDDLVDYRDIADAIMYWYLAGKQKREECGKEGRRWALNEGGINSENMCNQFILAMDYTLQHFSPSKPFDIFIPSDDYNLQNLPDNSIGFEKYTININNIKEEVSKL